MSVGSSNKPPQKNSFLNKETGCYCLSISKPSELQEPWILTLQIWHTSAEVTAHMWHLETFLQKPIFSIFTNMELAWEDFDQPFKELLPNSCPQIPMEHGTVIQSYSTFTRDLYGGSCTSQHISGNCSKIPTLIPQIIENHGVFFSAAVIEQCVTVHFSPHVHLPLSGTWVFEECLTIHSRRRSLLYSWIWSLWLGGHSWLRGCRGGWGNAVGGCRALLCCNCWMSNWENRDRCLHMLLET